MSFADVAADSYDRFMGRYSVPLAPLFADAAGVGDGGAEGRPRASFRALDAGCGPGALTAELVRRLGAPNVAAIDPEEAFVAAVRSRLPGVDARVAAAERLPFPDASVDAALAQLVVHFLADPAAGARELVRVTRPGGVVAVCVWDFAGGRAPQSLVASALAAVGVPGDDESGRVGARRGDLAALLRAAGCAEVAETELTVTVRHPGFDAWWEPYTLGVSPAGRRLAALDAAGRERVRALCRERVPDGPVTVSATAWCARGTVGAHPAA